MQKFCEFNFLSSHLNNQIVFCFHLVDVSFHFQSFQIFDLNWCWKCQLILINYSMRDSIIHELHTQKLFFYWHHFLWFIFCHISLPRVIFSRPAGLSNHHFVLTFLRQFFCSNYFSLLRDGISTSQSSSDSSQAPRDLVANDPYLSWMIWISQSHFNFRL